MNRSEELPPSPVEDETLTPAYSLLFRSWVVLVLLILCISFLQYFLVIANRVKSTS